jgi:hypothetical protein
MERTKYVSTCREIFGEDFLFDLFSEPASDIWKSATVQAKLKSRLRPTRVDQFIDAAESLNSALEKLLRKEEVSKRRPCAYPAIRNVCL